MIFRVFLALIFSFKALFGIILLDPAAVEILYLLGAENQIKAIAPTKTSEIYPANKTKNLPSIGSYAKPNLERIIELNPKIMILNERQTSIIADLKRFNINYHILKTNNINDIVENIKFLGSLTGKNEKAKELVSEFLSELKSLKSDKFQDKKVLFLFSSSPVMAFSSKTLPGEILNELGFKNAADKLNAKTPIISLEFIVENNPDFIIVASAKNSDFLRANPAIKHTKAAKNDKIFFIKAHSLMRASPLIIKEIKNLVDEF